MSRRDMACMAEGAGIVLAVVAAGAAITPMIHAAGFVIAAVQAVMGCC